VSHAPIEIVMIGTGLMADIYGSIIAQRADCKLVAVVGNTPEKTREFADRYGIAGYPGSDYAAPYKDFPTATTSIITTPEWVRVEPVRAAVEAGQHILLEKPFATSMSEADQLVALLDRPGKLGALCHVLRYSSRFSEMKRLVDAGEVGEVRHIFARRNSNRKRAERVLGKTDLVYWLSPHDVDIMRWVTGSEVVEVFARSRAGLRDKDDYLIANLRFANGVDAVLEISWVTPPLSGTSREAVFEVRGSGGALEVADFDMNVRLFKDENAVIAPDTYEYVDIHGAKRGFFEPMIDRFLDRVKNGPWDGAAIRDGFETVRVGDMIRRSLETGQVVRDG